MLIGSIAMVMAALLIRREAPSATGVAVTTSSFRRASATLADDVLALQMEDHYVRVHRLHGSELILMPLGRAIESMTAEELRTHRSWWVARHAIITVEGDARSMRLRHGLIAPVARSAIAHLKAAGWIHPPKACVGE